MTQIPEPLLLYSKKEIEEALDVYIKYFEQAGKNGNQSQAFINSKASLSMFVDNDAIKQAHERLIRSES